MKQSQHANAVLLARELFPELVRIVTSHDVSSDPEIRAGTKIAKDKLDLKISVIERFLNGLMSPLEAAANHDVSPYDSLETTIRRMNDELVDLRGYRAQNGS